MTRSTPLWALLWCAVPVAAAFGEEMEAAKQDPAGPPGVVVDRSPDPARVYIGSPSIAVLPRGDYVASHDWFGPGTENRRTAVLGSEDRGRTWRRLAELDGQWWSSLFVHRGALYIMGTSGQWGDAVIRRSTDGGKTWTTPKDRHTGLLAGGGQYHCAPCPWWCITAASGGRWKTAIPRRAGVAPSARW